MLLRAFSLRIDGGTSGTREHGRCSLPPYRWRVKAWRHRGRLLTSAALLVLVLIARARSDDEPEATIAVSSATSGSSLSGNLVEGVMTFRDSEYLLTLRGVGEPARTVGSVRGLLRARDIEGVFEPSDQGLRNTSGVTIRFDPPLSLRRGRLEIELLNRKYPKVSGGHRDGVE